MRFREGFLRASPVGLLVGIEHLGPGRREPRRTLRKESSVGL